MKKKFLLTLALVVGLGITGFATTADAGNIKDEPYKFYISSSGSINHTDARPKYDATSAYMMFDYISLSGYGGGYHVKVVDEKGNDFSKFWWSPYFTYDTPFRTEAWIPNHAYEDRGYGVQVKLKAEGSGGAGIWHSTGWWSPDSVGGN
ncbi:hypothetical protein [Clostridium sp. UBA1056]|uniref:hypothetical protein n=1 Tax=unclassified Clostridium TaxID=2614128 RepID=UPI003216218B